MSNYKPYLCVTQVFAQKEERNGQPGYATIFSDGWTTEHGWMPEDQFEAHYFPLEAANKISMADVERMMAHSEITSATVGDKTTVTQITLPTGFVYTEASSCVDPANYSEVVGREVAAKNAFEKLWPALGFVLQWALHGLIWKKEEKA